MTFDEIALNNREFKLLKKCAKGKIRINKKQTPEYKTLCRSDLAVAIAPVKNGKTQYLSEEVFLAITEDKGRPYLAYATEKRRDARWGRISYWITTIIAIIALVKSFLPELRALWAWLLIQSGH